MILAEADVERIVPPMVIDDVRKIFEGTIGVLTPAKAQQLAKDMMEPGAAKEQIAKSAADLLDWSQSNRDRLSTFIRREISDQMKSVGVATQADLDSVKKRVRDLERAAGKTASGRKSSTRKPAAKKASARKASTRSTPPATGPASSG
jgi:polyhydroxyalkanoate synthesis regulator phasin